MGIKEWVKEKGPKIKEWIKEKGSQVKDKSIETKDNVKDWHQGDSRSRRAVGWLGDKAKSVGSGAKSIGAFVLGWSISKFRSGSKLQLPRKTDAFSINMFIILAIVYQLALIFLNIATFWDKLIANIIFVLIIWLFILHSDERNSETLTYFMMIVLVFEIGIPFFLKSYFYHVDFVRGFFLNPLIMAWWFYYALLIRAQGRTWFAKILEIIVIIWWITFVLMTFSGSFSTTLGKAELPAVGAEQIEIAKEFYTKGIEGIGIIGSRIVGGVTNIKSYWKERMAMATGDYYVGRVEQTKGEELGVSIKNLKPAAPEFEADENIVVWGTLKAKTLDDGIEITQSCFEGNRDMPGEIITYGVSGPKTEFSVFDLSEEDVECSFKQGILRKKSGLWGSYKVTVAAEFNFETMAYLKTYFMDRDRLRGLLKEGIEPLEQFGIKDKNPTAVFSNGPVKLGIGAKKPPLPVTTDEVLRIGVTVGNNLGWGGRIKNINQLIIEVPDSIELVQDSCSHAFKYYTKEQCVADYIQYNSKPFIDCATKGDIDVYNEDGLKSIKQNPTQEILDCVIEVCDSEFNGYTSYMLDVEHAEGLENIKQYKTFNCKFNIVNPSSLLGTSPVTTRYIRARARYNYEVEASAYVKIKKTMDEDENLMAVSKKSYSPTAAAQKLNKPLEDNRGSYDKCLLYGIITEFSNGNENYVSGKRKGLMGISDNIAKEVAHGIDITGYNLLDVDTNIKLGVAILDKMPSALLAALPKKIITDAGYGTVKLENMNDRLIAFKDSMQNDEYTFDALKQSEKCSDKKVHECNEEEGYEKYRSYLLNIESYNNYCMDKKLFEKTSTFSSEVNIKDFWSPPVSFTVAQDSNLGIESLEPRYKVEIIKSIKKDAPSKVTIKLKKSGRDVFYKSFAFEKGKETSTEWVYGSKYPFLRIKFSKTAEDGYTFLFQEFKESVLNIETTTRLLIKKPLWQDNKDVIVNMLFDSKTKALNLYDKDENKFCSINVEQQNTCQNLPEVNFELTSLKGDLLTAWIEYNPDGALT